YVVEDRPFRSGIREQREGWLAGVVQRDDLTVDHGIVGEPREPLDDSWITIGEVLVVARAQKDPTAGLERDRAVPIELEAIFVLRPIVRQPVRWQQEHGLDEHCLHAHRPSLAVRGAPMTFTKRLREGIRRGRIRCSIRIWMRPHVKVGGRYRMDDGHIVVDSITPTALTDITHDLARESGFDGVEDLLRIARHGRGDHVYLIRFHYLPPGGW